MAESTATHTTSAAIGEVQSVTGRVIAVGADGVERQLVAGDSVFADDLIRTVGQSSIQVMMADGSRIELGQDAEALLDEAVHGDDIEAQRAAALAEAAEIQAAITAGADPVEVAEPPAAGNETAANGESLETATGLERTGRVGTVEAGYETAGLAQDFNPLLADAIEFSNDGGDAAGDGGSGNLGGVLPTAPVVTISLGAVTGDNIIDAAEGASALLPVSGSVGGDVVNGDLVTLVVGGNSYSGTVSGGGFTINVPGAVLAADSSISASITITNGFGISTTATDSQSYTVDTGVPGAPVVTIAEDANNDGLISAAESSGAIDVALGLPPGAMAGDVLTVTDGTLIRTITLSPVDVVNGTVTTSFPNPGDGNTISVTATLTDAAGNTSPQGSDSAQLDTTAPTIDIDPVTGDNQVDDAEDDSVTLSGTSTGAVGQAVSVAIVDGGGNTVFTGNATVQPDGSWSIPNVDLSGLPDEAGYTVTADVSDAAGNAAVQATEPFTTEDTTAPGAPTVTITEDTDNNGVISGTEHSVPVDVLVSLPADAVVGDTLVISDGSTTSTVVLTAVILGAGAVAATFPSPGNGNTITVTATLTDAAGNTSAPGSDSALVDLSVGNLPPVAENDSDTLSLGLEPSVSGNVLGNDADPDGQPAPLTVANPGSYSGNYGTLVLNTDGSYTYTVDQAAAEAALLGPTGGMVAHWTFDSASGNTVPDEAPTGTPNNVSLNGNSLVADGQIGGAVVLDGSSRLTMGNSAEINLGIHTQRTISLHFNADDVSGRQVLYEEGAQVRGLNIFIDNGNLYAGGWNTPNGESDWDGDWVNLGPVNAGEWNHVALVLDGGPVVTAGALTAYLNGSPAGSVQGSQLWQHSGDVSIGGSGGNSVYPDGNSSSRYHFSGMIDDVRIYNAPVSAADVAILAAQDGTLTDTFGYTATDGASNSNNADLSILIDSVPPTAPVTADVLATGSEDTAIVFAADDFAFTDANAADSLQAVRIDSVPAAGALQFFDGALWQAVAAGQAIDLADIQAGNFRFVPAGDESGIDAFGGAGVGDQQADYARFDYAVSDGVLFSNTATFTIDVAPVADLPDLAATLNTTPVVSQQTLLSEDFNDGDANGWTAVDLGPNPILNVSQGTGNWVVENGVLEQNDPAGAEHTFMRYDSTPAIRALDNYTISVDIDPNRSGSDLGVTNNAVGLVFGYTDAANYYRVEWVNFSSSYAPGGSNANTYGGGELHKDFRLVRVQGGTETILTQIDMADISNGELFTLTLRVGAGDGIVAQANGYTISHTDVPPLQDFGLYSWDNDNDIGYDNVVLNTNEYRYDMGITADLVDLDGSELLTINASNVPAGAVLSAGTQNPDGSWTLGSADLPGLQLVSAQPLADPAVTVTAVATETANGDEASRIIALGGDGILVGGPGEDLFVTGSGDDTLVWGSGDQGLADSPVVDRVSGFDHQSDVLDIRNLLVDETQGSLTDYLHFEQDGADGVVHVSTSGGFSGGYMPAAEDQTIVLENVDIGSLGNTDQEIINALLTSNSLVTD